MKLNKPQREQPRWIKAEQKALLNEATWIRKKLSEEVQDGSRQGSAYYSDWYKPSKVADDALDIKNGHLPLDIRNHFGAPKGARLLDITGPRHYDQAVANGGVYSKGISDNPLYFKGPRMEFAKLKSPKHIRQNFAASCRDLEELLKLKKMREEEKKSDIQKP